MLKPYAKSLSWSFDFLRPNFVFTLPLKKWLENSGSNTLSYKEEQNDGPSIRIAEIQVFDDKPKHFWILRFYLDEMESFIAKAKRNTEVYGMSAELAVCNKCGIELDEKKKNKLEKRSEEKYVESFSACLDWAFDRKNLPKAVKHIGDKQTGQKKSPHDFVLEDGSSLSLKTNRVGSALVCPPGIGQANDVSCYNYFKKLLPSSSTTMTKKEFKKMYFASPAKVLSTYLEALMSSDHLLWIQEGDRLNSMRAMIISKKNGVVPKIEWDENKIESTKSKDDVWNVSNTIKYQGRKIGEFEVHDTRNSFKFRFDIEYLAELLEQENLVKVKRYGYAK